MRTDSAPGLCIASRLQFIVVVIGQNLRRRKPIEQPQFSFEFSYFIAEGTDFPKKFLVAARQITNIPPAHHFTFAVKVPA
jgi:hypothetical protein